MQWFGWIVRFILIGFEAKCFEKLKFQNVCYKVGHILSISRDVEFSAGIEKFFISSGWRANLLIFFPADEFIRNITREQFSNIKKAISYFGTINSPKLFIIFVPVKFINFPTENVIAIQIEKQTKWQKCNSFQCHFKQSINIILFCVLVVVQYFYLML